MSGRFKGLGKAKTKGRGTGIYFLPGNHIVKVSEVKFEKSTQKRGVQNFIIAGKPVMTDNEAQKVGVEASVVHSLDGGYGDDAKWGDIKQFCAAVADIDDPDGYVPEDAEGLQGEEYDEAVDAFWAELADAIVDAGLAKDKYLGCFGYNIKVGKDLAPEDKKDFTKLEWSHLSDEEVAEMGLA